MSEASKTADESIRNAILVAVTQRGPGKTICPSEVARALGSDWRMLMPDVRRVASTLASDGKIKVTQKGAEVDALAAKGPIRLSLP